MIRISWKLGWTPVMAAALAATPLPVLVQTAHADPPNNSDSKVTAADSKALRDLSQKIDGLSRQITTLQNNLDSIKAGVKADRETDLEQINGNFRRIDENLRNMGRDLRQLRADVDDLKRRGPATSTSAYAGAAPANSGRVLMENRYSMPVTVLVNRKSYHLNPGETRVSDPLPAGDFTYQVLWETGNGDFQAVTQTRTRRVSGNGTYTVTIHPQGI